MCLRGIATAATLAKCFPLHLVFALMPYLFGEGDHGFFQAFPSSALSTVESLNTRQLRNLAARRVRPETHSRDLSIPAALESYQLSPISQRHGRGGGVGRGLGVG